jgi:ParB-like chromosome segregation protein Spo0J
MRVEVPFSRLVPTEKQARQRYMHLDELAASIAEHGLLQNLVVKERPDGTLEVIAGERRRRAIAILMMPLNDQIKEYDRVLGNWQGGGAEKSGCPNGGVPVFVLPKSADDAAAHLIENVEREDLWPWEVGRVLAAWHDAGYTHEWIAERIGKPRQVTSRLIMFGNQLSPKVTEAIEKIGDRTLIGKKMLEKISRIYDPVMREPLHIKQVEEFEKILGKARTYVPPEESKSERIRVHERAKRLARMGLPGHAKPYVKAIYEYLFEEGYGSKPDFNWK